MNSTAPLDFGMLNTLALQRLPNEPHPSRHHISLHASIFYELSHPNFRNNYSDQVTEFFHLYFNKFSFAISKSEKGFHLASPVILLTFQVLDNWDDWKKRFRSGVISLVLKRLKARINKGVFVSPQVHKANQLYMYNCCVALNEGKLTHHHGVHSSSPGL